MEPNHRTTPNATSFVGLIAFAFIFWSILSQQMPHARATWIVAGHFAAMILSLLAIGSSIAEKGTRQFGVLAMLGASALLALYISLLRVCLLPVRLDNLGIGGWFALVVTASLTGWSLVVVLAEVTSCVVWWLARHRGR